MTFGQVGQNQIVSLNGELQITGGTSASAPIFAGMLALINNERIARGQPVGDEEPHRRDNAAFKIQRHLGVLLTDAP